MGERELFSNVYTISATTFAVGTAYYMWWNLLPLHFKDLGATDAQIGMVYSLAIVVNALFMLIGGFLGDRFGRKPTIVWPTFAFGALYAILALPLPFWGVAALFLLSDAAHSLQSPSFNAMIFESAGRSISRALGAFEAGITLGVALGPLIGALLIGKVGMRGIFLLNAVVALVCGTIRQALLTESAKKGEKGERLERLRVSPELVRIIAFFGISSLVISLTFSSPLPSLFQKEVLGFGKREVNLAFSIGWGIGAVVSFLVPLLREEAIANPTVAAVCMLVQTVLLVIWASTKKIIFFFASFPIFVLLHISLKALMARVLPREVLGRLLGVILTVSSLIGAVGPTLVIAIKERLGYTLAFATPLPLVLLVFLMRRWLAGRGSTVRP